MKIIIACRHGEAYKNRRNIYGGKGDGLTPEGVVQIEELCKQLQAVVAKNPLPSSLYKSCERVQINESANLIAQNLNIAQVQTDPYVGWVEGLFVESQLSPQCTHTQTLGRLAALLKEKGPACQRASCHQSRWAQARAAAEHACALWPQAYFSFVFNLQETNSCSERLSLQSRSQEGSKEIKIFISCSET